jgi:hypothetical protein
VAVLAELTVVRTQVRMDHGKPEKSWNINISKPKPGNPKKIIDRFNNHFSFRFQNWHIGFKRTLYPVLRSVVLVMEIDGKFTFYMHTLFTYFPFNSHNKLHAVSIFAWYFLYNRVNGLTGVSI